MTKVHTIKVPLPFPVKWINAYYVEDSVPTLIDTGINTNESLQVLRSAISATGGTLEGIRRVIVTHGHIDHMGLAGTIARISGAEVFIHTWDKSKTTIVEPEHVSQTRRKYSAFFAKAGMPESTGDELVDLVVTRLENLCNPLSQTTALNGGEVFQFDDIDLHVIHTPGHTPGSVCLFDPLHGHLYSGDSLIEEMSFNPVTDVLTVNGGHAYQSLRMYRQSWDRVHEMNIREVFPGHGRPYSNWREKIDRLRRFHDRRSREILRILGTQPAAQASQSGLTRLEVARQLFPAMQGIEVFHRIAAVRAHLQVLESDALVLSKQGDTGLIYSLS